MPKSLLPIGGKVIIDRIISKIAVIGGMKEIAVVTNAKFYSKFDKWRLLAPYNKMITLVNDGTISNDTRLGAIRDIELALDNTGADDDMLVVAGDNLFDFDISLFMDFAKSHSDGVSIALYDVRDISQASKYGIVKIDERCRVIDFQEKPSEPKSTLSSTGIYYFPKNKLSFIKEYVKMQNKLDAPGYYIGWLSQTDNVYGFTFKEDWYDIGSLESYKKADDDYNKKEKS